MVQNMSLLKGGTGPSPASMNEDQPTMWESVTFNILDSNKVITLLAAMVIT